LEGLYADGRIMNWLLNKDRKTANLINLAQDKDKWWDLV
jgi:hypothetical protein